MTTLQELVAQIKEDQKSKTTPPFPRQLLIEFAEGLYGAIFTECAPKSLHDDLSCENYLRGLAQQLTSLGQALPEGVPPHLDETLWRILSKIRPILTQDAAYIADEDPAAGGKLEVVLAYPGIRCIAIYRFAHELNLSGMHLLARLLTEYAHEKTGIDIHPAAKIGHPFYIDHGTGIVIGETSVIGDRVKIFQGVTLGALSVSTHHRKTKRHPTIENDVVLYSNASILGGNTIVGEGSVIGGNVWLTESVPPHSIVQHHNEVKLSSKLKS
jgi:serine O-acetyltransferase